MMQTCKKPARELRGTPFLRPEAITCSIRHDFRLNKSRAYSVVARRSKCLVVLRLHPGWGYAAIMQNNIANAMSLHVQSLACN
jgi:hypothetical protein